MMDQVFEVSKRELPEEERQKLRKIRGELIVPVRLKGELRGRKVASRFRLKFIGLLGVLVQAKRKGLTVAVKPVLDDLIGKAGFWVSSQLYARVLQWENKNLARSEGAVTSHHRSWHASGYVLQDRKRGSHKPKLDRYWRTEVSIQPVRQHAELRR